jgi:hypothetical protein
MLGFRSRRAVVEDQWDRPVRARHLQVEKAAVLQLDHAHLPDPAGAPVQPQADP